MKKRKAIRLLRRILWCTALLAWAGVTVYTFGFHHHHPEDGDCEQRACPFLIVTLNLPLLIVFVLLPVVQLPKYAIGVFCVPLLSRRVTSFLPARAPPLLFS